MQIFFNVYETFSLRWKPLNSLIKVVLYFSSTKRIFSQIDKFQSGIVLNYDVINEITSLFLYTGRIKKSTS